MILCQKLSEMIYDPIHTRKLWRTYLPPEEFVSLLLLNLLENFWLGGMLQCITGLHKIELLTIRRIKLHLIPSAVIVYMKRMN